MRKKLKNLMFLVAVLFACSFAVAAQEDKPVCISQTAADNCAKAFNEVKASREAITALQSEIEARRKENAINEQIIEKQKFLLEQMEKERQILIKNSRKQLSILFGLIKLRF